MRCLQQYAFCLLSLRILDGRTGAFERMKRRARFLGRYPFSGYLLARERPTVTARSSLPPEAWFLSLSLPTDFQALLKGREFAGSLGSKSGCRVVLLVLHDGHRPTFDFSEGFGYLCREIDSVRCLSSRAPPVARGQREVQRVAPERCDRPFLSLVPCLVREVPHYPFFFEKKNFVAKRERAFERTLCTKKKITTLSGGSLGSCVDEERSQLRELM